MEKLGLADSCVALGCPTLFINTDPKLGQKIANRFKYPKKIGLAIGDPGWKENEKIETIVFEHIVKNQSGAFIIQQIADFSYPIVIDDIYKVPRRQINSLYRHFGGNMGLTEFICALQKFSKLFIDIPTWIRYLQDFDFVVGPRIHGTMMAIQAGTPALCVAMDSRTTELCQIMKIPYMSPYDLQECDSVNDLLEHFKFDSDEFDSNRRLLMKRYQKFLAGNKLRYDDSLNEILDGDFLN